MSLWNKTEAAEQQNRPDTAKSFLLYIKRFCFNRPLQKLELELELYTKFHSWATRPEIGQTDCIA